MSGFSEGFSVSEYGTVRIKELIQRINQGMSDITGADIPVYESAARLGYTTPPVRAGDTEYVYTGVGVSVAGMTLLFDIPDPLP